MNLPHLNTAETGATFAHRMANYFAELVARDAIGAEHLSPYARQVAARKMRDWRDAAIWDETIGLA